MASEERQARWKVPLFLVSGFAVRPRGCGGTSPLGTVRFFWVSGFAVSPHGCGGSSPLGMSLFFWLGGSLSVRMAAVGQVRWECPLFLVERVRCPPAHLRRGKSANTNYWTLCQFRFYNECI
ncbi:MAG: hypothetical protein HY865_19215 [Chloroflexi bacterium]|nr:hypothetical protein [Chloroflexota bacterium]